MLERATRVPACFGRYLAKDRECDGGAGEAPCVFRDRCFALKLAVEDGRTSLEGKVRNERVIVDGLGDIVLEAMLRYQVRNGRALRRFDQRSRFSLKYADRPPSERFARDREALDRLVAYFFRRIANVAGVGLYPERRLAEHNSLYIADYEGIHGYTALGYRIVGTTYRSVVRIWKRQYRPRTLVTDLPYSRAMLESVIGCDVVAKMAFDSPDKHSAFQVRVSNLDRALAEKVAVALGESIKSGMFNTRSRKEKSK